MRKRWAVVATVVFGLGCMVPLSVNAQSSADSAYGSAGNGILNAVFQSERGSMALIDGVAYRQGDRVDGAEILAIEAGSIRLRTGAGDYTAWVGSELPDVVPLPAPVARPASPPVTLAVDVTAPDAEIASPSAPAEGAGTGHLVAYGETLSEIAVRYKPGDMSLFTAILEIFEANRSIFGENMDDLRSGVTLIIPPQFGPGADPMSESIQPGVAVASVVDEADELPGDTELPPEEFGPVAYGDSLSLIAERIAPPGVSTYSMMRALYEANPHAFGGSMDLLFAGEVLQMPPALWQQLHGSPGDVLARVEPPPASPTGD